MRNAGMIIWAMIVVLVAAGNSRATLTGYVVRYLENDEVYFTNFDTGEQTLLGQTNIPPLSNPMIRALDISPIDGRLFAIGYDDLWTINTISGVGSRIGNVGTTSIENLSFAPDGTLYGITSRYDPHLVTIDTVTGKTTDIGSTLPYLDTCAFAIDENGRAIAQGRSNIASQYELFEVDLTDGSTSSIGYLEGGFSAFDYGPDGILYGWEENGMAGLYIDYFYSIDVGNLTATQLRSFSNGWSQFAIIPEPATLLLLGLGGLSLLRKRRV